MSWIKKVETQEQADKMNAEQAAYPNGKTDWKVGDQYCSQEDVAGLMMFGDPVEIKEEGVAGGSTTIKDG